MTSVYFVVHRFTTGIEELDEHALIGLLDRDSGLVTSLCEQEGQGFDVDPANHRAAPCALRDD